MFVGFFFLYDTNVSTLATNVYFSSDSIYDIFISKLYYKLCWISIFFIDTGLLPCHLDKVTVTPVVPDPKNALLVCGEKPGMPTPLNVGETNVKIEVTSADGSNKQVYKSYKNR